MTRRTSVWRASGIRPAPTEETYYRPETTEDYVIHARRQCRAYINQLIRMFGPAPPPGYFVVDRIPGINTDNVLSLGERFCVTLWVDGEDPAAVAYSRRVLQNLPKTWDDEAREELLQTDPRLVWYGDFRVDYAVLLGGEVHDFRTHRIDQAIETDSLDDLPDHAMLEEVRHELARRLRRYVDQAIVEKMGALGLSAEFDRLLHDENGDPWAFAASAIPRFQKFFARTCMEGRKHLDPTSIQPSCRAYGRPRGV